LISIVLRLCSLQNIITPQFVPFKFQFSLSAVMGISKLPVTLDSIGYEYDQPSHFFTLLCCSIHNAVNKKGSICAVSPNFTLCAWVLLIVNKM